MGFIKWIGLFSGFAQTQSVLGAIAGFVIGSVIDSIWSGDSKPTAAQSSTETTSTSAEDSRSRFLFSLMVLASHVIQADGKIMHSEMETVRKFLRNTFGETSVEEGNNILLRLFEYRKNRGEAEWQMEIRPQHRRLVAGTRPATTLSPVAYITTDFIGCALLRSKHNAASVKSAPSA